jgi:hypothetical protein
MLSELRRYAESKITVPAGGNQHTSCFMFSAGSDGFVGEYLSIGQGRKNEGIAVGLDHAKISPLFWSQTASDTPESMLLPGHGLVPIIVCMRPLRPEGGNVYFDLTGFDQDKARALLDFVVAKWFPSFIKVKLEPGL